MSRIQKYKESLVRFIKDKSCLMEDNDNINIAKLNDYIYSVIKETDLILPILLLTIMNNQNKKNHISMQSYYIATSIEFSIILLHFIENRNDIIEKFDNDTYIKLYNFLFIYINKSLQQNIESVKNILQGPNLINTILNSLNMFNDFFKMSNSFGDFKFDITNKNCDNNIINWYLKNNDELINKFNTFKQVSKESMFEYIEKKYIHVSILAISLGWIIGSGDFKELNKLKKSAQSFALMYKIAKDFENLDKDIINGKDFTSNYVLNYGLQDGYEVFLNNKQKFIEESMIEDIYTNTIKEIIDSIEENIDSIIDQTSPDLKSNYSKT